MAVPDDSNIISRKHRCKRSIIRMLRWLDCQFRLRLRGRNSQVCALAVTDEIFLEYSAAPDGAGKSTSKQTYSRTVRRISAAQMTPIALMSRSEEMSDNSSGIFDQRAVGPVGKRGWRISYSR
jgi:hypothetical protein